MKAKLLIIIGCIALFAHGFVFAQYGNYKGEVAMSEPAPLYVPKPLCYNSPSCASASNECSDSCGSCSGGSTCGNCGCTDPNCTSNSCISPKRFCRLFGNIGAADFDDEAGPCG